MKNKVKTNSKVSKKKTPSKKQSISKSSLLMQWIKPAYLDAKKLRASYNRAKPFPHIALNGFFKAQKADTLREALVTMAKQGGFTHKESDLFSLAQSSALNNTQNSEIKSLVSFFSSKEWNEYLIALTGARLSGKELDIGGSLYQDTDYLLCHDDQVTGRKIAFIYYLGPDFNTKDGGALALLDSKGKRPGKVVKRMLPKYNTLAMFTVSSKSWHAVEEVTSEKPRLSINGWFH